MVDRVECPFVQMVRNAHRVGAATVVIWDNTCLCLAESDTPHFSSILIKSFIGLLPMEIDLGYFCPLFQCLEITHVDISVDTTIL